MKVDIWSLFALAGLPKPEEEYEFAKSLGRYWRFDWAWPEYMVALELDGGNWKRGRHSRPRGIEEDHCKRNAAQLLGWKVFTVTTDMAADGRLLALLEQVKEMVKS